MRDRVADGNGRAAVFIVKSVVSVDGVVREVEGVAGSKVSLL